MRIPRRDIAAVGARQHAVVGKLQAVLSSAVTAGKAQHVAGESAGGVITLGPRLKEDHILEIVVGNKLAHIGRHVLVHVARKRAVKVLSVGGLG